MGKLRNQSILLLGFLTPFYTTFIRSFQRNKSLPEFVKFASQVKYACGVEIPAGVRLCLGVLLVVLSSLLFPFGRSLAYEKRHDFAHVFFHSPSRSRNVTASSRTLEPRSP